MKQTTIGNIHPAWTFTEQEFIEKLGLPHDADVIVVSMDRITGVVTVVGSHKLCKVAAEDMDHQFRERLVATEGTQCHSSI